MLTLHEKIEIVLICGENTVHRVAANIFNERHPGKNVQQSTVSRIMAKFKSTGSVENLFKKPRNPIKHNEEVQLNVCLDVVEHSQTSIRHVSTRTTVQRESVRSILHKNKFKPYKPKFINTLKEQDFDLRLGFSFWYQGEKEEDISFPFHVLWTDEATFTSNGVVSSQNCRWWAQENPNFIIECRDQYSFKTNVWCGVLNDQVIGPYFFRGNLNSEEYLRLLNTEILEVLDNIPVELRHNLWYQCDGAPIHNTRHVQERLLEIFRGKVIGRNMEQYWPPRSPDLTPLDFFLWGYLKQKVYKKRPFRNIDHLETVIRNCLLEIRPIAIRNAIIDVSRRTILCIERNGRHTEM